jgi:hypothetical protein
VCSSWLEYKNDCAKENIPKKNIIDFLSFRIEVAYSLTMSGNVATIKKRGCPRSSSKKENYNKK